MFIQNHQRVVAAATSTTSRCLHLNRLPLGHSETTKIEKGVAGTISFQAGGRVQ